MENKTSKTSGSSPAISIPNVQLKTSPSSMPSFKSPAQSMPKLQSSNSPAQYQSPLSDQPSSCTPSEQSSHGFLIIF